MRVLVTATRVCRAWAWDVHRDIVLLSPRPSKRDREGQKKKSDKTEGECGQQERTAEGGDGVCGVVGG